MIGWPLFAGEIIQIELPRVQFLQKLPNETERWAKFLLKTNSDILEFEMENNGRRTDVVIDTGNDEGISLSPKRWKEWTLKNADTLKNLSAGYMPGAGLVVSEVVFAKTFDLGLLHLTDVCLTKANVAQGGDNSQFEASIGLKALKRLDCIIDGGHGVLYVRPKTNAAPVFPHNRIGAVFVPKHPETDDDLVARVIESSPAYKAGIRSGDILLKIERLDVTRWRVDPAVLPLARFWEQPAGTRILLVLKREKQQFSTTVTLHDILTADAGVQLEGN